MLSHLDTLPFEILASINQHLGNQDRYQLCLVNRSLNDFFKNHILYAVFFHSVDQAIHSCRRLALEPFLFWKINTLSINIPFSTQCPYNTFLKFCVNLKVFTIGERFWESLDDFDGDGEMLVDLDSYPVIPTLLELDIACAHFYGIEDLLALFIKFPNIKRLTLRQLFLMAKPNDLEQVHAICPNLESLTLDYKHAFQPPLTRDVLQPRQRGSLDTPSLAMKHLSIFHNGRWDEFTPSIFYIADKYPHLESLDISFVPTWQNNYGQTNFAGMAPLESAIRVMVNLCQSLESVRFENVWWASIFFRYYFNKYHVQRQDTTALRRVGVVANYVDTKIATSIFNLITVSVLSTVTSLDLTLHTETMMACPLRMYQSFRDARMLTDLRISTPGNQTTTTSILWFLEFCPVLRSLVLDNGSIGIDFDNERWLTRRMQRQTLPTHRLVRLALTNCVFTNDIFAYLDQTCPGLSQLSITNSLLHRSPSLRLCFPRHVFRTIRINHVRVASVSDLTCPISSAYIDNPVTWTGNCRPVEFITIQRHHIRGTAPTSRLGPCYIQNQHIFPTRSMKRQLLASGGPYQRKSQTFKVTSMTFCNPQQQSTGNGTTFGSTKADDYTKVMGVISFLPLELIDTFKCMTERELDYYGNLGCFSLFGDGDSSSPSPLESRSFTWTTTESNKRRKLQELTRITQPHSGAGNRMGSSLQQQQHISDITIGGHLMVDVYGITELEVNGKWMVV